MWGKAIPAVWFATMAGVDWYFVAGKMTGWKSDPLSSATAEERVRERRSGD
jgi:hypothetical protein